MAKKKKAIIRLGENSGIANNIWLFQSLDLCGTLEWDNLLFSKKKKKKNRSELYNQKELTASVLQLVYGDISLLSRQGPTSVHLY